MEPEELADRNIEVESQSMPEETKQTGPSNLAGMMVRIVDEHGLAWYIRPHLVRWIKPAPIAGAIVDVAGVHTIFCKESPDEVAGLLTFILPKGN